MTGFLLIVGLLAVTAGTWILALSVRFLRSGRKAFDLYVEKNSESPMQTHPPTEIQGRRPARWGGQGPGTGI